MNEKNPCVKSQSKIYVIIKKLFTEILHKKNHVLNHSQKFVIVKNLFIEILNKKIHVLNHS